MEILAYKNNNNYTEPCADIQKHVHELQGSVKIADRDCPHNHRFCTVSGEAIAYGENDHVHEVVFRTDSFNGHYHEFCGKTSCAIPVGNRHVHYIDSITSVDDGHKHTFEAATLIENPTGYKKEDNYRQRDEQYRRNDNYRRR